MVRSCWARRGGGLREIEAQGESETSTLNSDLALRPGCGVSNPCDALLELSSIRDVQKNGRVDVQLAVCFNSRAMFGQGYDRRAFLEALSSGIRSYQCHGDVHNDARTLHGVGGRRPPFLCVEQFDELAEFVAVFLP